MSAFRLSALCLIVSQSSGQDAGGFGVFVPFFHAGRIAELSEPFQKADESFSLAPVSLSERVSEILSPRLRAVVRTGDQIRRSDQRRRHRRPVRTRTSGPRHSAADDADHESAPPRSRHPGALALAAACHQRPRSDSRKDAATGRRAGFLAQTKEIVVSNQDYEPNCTSSLSPNSFRPERASSALAWPGSPSAGTSNVTCNFSPGVEAKRLSTFV